jgi:hypothetical protein
MADHQKISYLQTDLDIIGETYFPSYFAEGVRRNIPWREFKDVCLFFDEPERRLPGFDEAMSRGTDLGKYLANSGGDMSVSPEFRHAFSTFAKTRNFSLLHSIGSMLEQRFSTHYLGFGHHFEDSPSREFPAEVRSNLDCIDRYVRNVHCNFDTEPEGFNALSQEDQEKIITIKQLFEQRRFNEPLEGYPLSFFRLCGAVNRPSPDTPILTNSETADVLSTVIGYYSNRVIQAYSKETGKEYHPGHVLSRE